MRDSISTPLGSGWPAATRGPSSWLATTSRRRHRRCLVFAPLAPLPPDVGVAIVAAAVIGGALATVRLLRLPWWWLLFPPLVQSILSANVQSLIVPLILVNAGALAFILKIYAGLPLLILGRWRSLLIAAGILVVTFPLLPWSTYIEEFALISQRLAAQSELTLPTGLLLLLSPLVVAALYVVGRERAAWLVVPAIWPSQQFYYGTIAMPAGARSPWPSSPCRCPGNGLLALGALAIVTWSHGERGAWGFFRVPRRRTGVPDRPSLDAEGSS